MKFKSLSLKRTERERALVDAGWQRYYVGWWPKNIQDYWVRREWAERRYVVEKLGFEDVLRGYRYRLIESKAPEQEGA